MMRERRPASSHQRLKRFHSKQIRFPLKRPLFGMSFKLYSLIPRVPLQKQVRVNTAAKDAIATACAKYVTMDHRPFEAIIGTGIHQLIPSIMDITASYGAQDVASLLPYPITVRRRVESGSKDLHRKMFPVSFESVGVAVATDFLTVSHTGPSYIGITTRFLDYMQVHSHVVIANAFNPSVEKSAVNVRRYFTTRMPDVGIEDTETANKTWVTDAAPNHVAACKLSAYVFGVLIGCAGLLDIVLSDARKSSPKSSISSMAI